MQCVGLVKTAVITSHARQRLEERYTGPAHFALADLKSLDKALALKPLPAVGYANLRDGSKAIFKRKKNKHIITTVLSPSMATNDVEVALNRTVPKPDSKYYHGSPTPDLKQLKPRHDPRTETKALFTKQDPESALIYALLPNRAKSNVTHSTVGGKFTEGHVVSPEPLLPEGYLYTLPKVTGKASGDSYLINKAVKPLSVRKVTQEDARKAGWTWDVKTASPFLGDYARHSALNLGQATRDVRYLGEHPNADKVAPKGSVKHVVSSVIARAPSLTSNLYYSALPPQLHHTEEELSESRGKSLKQLFREGYNPWEQDKTAKVKTPLKEHQQRVLDKIQREDQPGLLVAHGLGSGKTLTAIAAQDALGIPSVVAVPAALQDNYKKELTKHLKGTSPEAAITTLQRISRSSEGIKAPLLVVDEAHRAREITSQTHKALKNAISDKRILLTASPFYNRPSDVAGLVNLVAGGKVLEDDPIRFREKYIHERKVSPGFRGWLRGAKPGVVQELNKSQEKHIRETFSKWVDYHPSSKDEFPSVTRVTKPVEMSQEQLKIYDTLLGKAPPWVAFKIRAGLPPSKQEARQLNAFSSAVRQISNTTRAYTPGKEPQEPKIEKAFQNLKTELGKNTKSKAIVYSNYLTSGVVPYRERLEKSKIPFGEYTGAMKRKDRDQLVRDFNTGKKRVILLSSAGGEGLDLKGTRLVQILEPHWNNEKLKQVEGRAIRYKSHAHLPEGQRNVRVESYMATRPESGLLERIGLKKPGSGIDQYLRTMSKTKEDLIGQFSALMKKEKSAK